MKQCDQFRQKLKERVSLDAYSEEEKRDKNIVLAAIYHNPKQFKHAHAVIKQDKTFVSEIVALNPYLFKFAANNLRHDREFILQVLADDSGNYPIMKYIPKALLSDREFVIAAFHSSPKSFQYADSKIKQGRALVLHVLKVDGSLYEQLPGWLQNDKQVAKTAIRSCGTMFEHIPK